MRGSGNWVRRLPLRTGSGGGLLGDIITREEPLVFKPGQFYVLARSPAR